MSSHRKLLVGIRVPGMRTGEDCAGRVARILVDEAVAQAVAIEASLQIVNVVESQARRSRTASFPIVSRWDGNAAEEFLMGLCHSVRKYGVRVDCRIRCGDPVEQLALEADSFCADVIMVGNRTAGVVGKTFTSGVARHLLHECSVPIWIARMGRKAPATILVAHNLRSSGDVALREGCQIAAKCKAQLHVIHALQCAEFNSAWPRTIPAARLATYRAAARERINGQLAAARLNRPVRVHIDYGSPEAPILNLSHRLHPDLVVLGRTSRNRMHRIVFGHTAERITPHLECSTLIIKGDASHRFADPDAASQFSARSSHAIPA